MHAQLVRQAYHIDHKTSPELTRIAIEAAGKLDVHGIELFLVRSQQRNAYTFGLEKPQTVVLYSSLLEIMDADELKFVIGHELGHVALGHTWLNTLLGGMAGVPTNIALSAILTLAFKSWNRACEYSADRAGLLACGKPEKAISALVKLAAGPQADTPVELAQAYRQIDAEDDTWMGGLNEALGTHPMLIRRIRQIRAYAGTAEYRRLVERMAQAG
jgi:Zn-dependent protease with chaperone function